MDRLLDKYGISKDLSPDQTLILLEKERQKLLRKLNHVFGDPQKEAALSRELTEVENTIGALEQQGGKISFDDVLLQTRSLTQTSVSPKSAKLEKIRELENQILTEDAYLSDVLDAFQQVLEYYIDCGNSQKQEYWLTYGAKKGAVACMKALYELYLDGTFGKDERKAFFWLKQAADHGHKDCCEILGNYYSDPASPDFDPRKAVTLLIKAADRNHPKAFLESAAMFLYLKDYVKAETCLRAADQILVPGAAYRLGILYESGKNSLGHSDIPTALRYYEKALSENPDGDVCYRLGSLYLKIGDRSNAATVLKRGSTSFSSELCAKLLSSL